MAVAGAGAEWKKIQNPNTTQGGNTMKKTLALILALVMAMSLCSFSVAEERETAVAADGTVFYKTGLPIVDPALNYTVTMWGTTTASDPNTFEMVQKWEADTGINFEIVGVSADGKEERKNLMWASGDYPAVLGPQIVNENDLATYGPMGVLIDLKPYIDEYMTESRQWVSEEAWNNIWGQLTYPNGAIYSFPTVTAYYKCDSTVPSINTTWLAKLGMDIPETPEEFVEYLRAVKNTDLNGNGKADEVPMTTQNWEGVYEAYAVAGWTGELTGIKQIEDGKVVLPLIGEATKQQAIWLNQLWNEGLIDMEIYTQDENMMKGRAQNPELTFGFSTVWREGNVFGEELARNYFPMKPLKGEAGTQKWYGTQDTTYVGINWALTANCGAPEIMARFIDYMWDPYISMQNNYGPYDVAWKKIEDPAYPDGLWEQVCPEGFTTIGDWFVDNHFQQVPRLCYGFHEEANNGYGLKFKDPNLPDWRTLTTSLVDAEGRFCKGGDQKYVHDNILGDCIINDFPPVKPTQEETDELNLIEPDFEKYVEESLTRFITGEMNIETEWDTYVETVKSMGYERLLEIYQQQYDRYIGK